MSIEFKDIDGNEGIPGKASILSRIGVLLSGENGEWHSFRPGSNFLKSGTGMPQKLEPGFWVSDMAFDEVKAIARSLPGVTLRSDGWLRMTTPQMRAALGLTGQPAGVALRFIATVCDRVFNLTQDAIAGSLTDLGFSNMAEAVGRLERAPSLATGIATINHRSISGSATADVNIRHYLDTAFQAGMIVPKRKGREEGSILLSFHFPKFSYAKKLTEQPVPSGAGWQRANRKAETGIETFRAEILKTGHPIIFMALCHPGERALPEPIRYFANSFASGGIETYRSLFLLEEIEVLDPYFDLQIEGALALSRNGWGPSTVGRLVRSLEAAAGGEQVAAASWSAGLAAENILISAFRSGARKVDSRSQKEDLSWSAESVWLAARDRRVMLPAIRAICDAGAALASAQAGNIVVKCPEDPEILTGVVNAAWEAGLILPLEEVEALRDYGVHPPTEQSIYGGNPVDFLMSTLVHMGKRKALLVLDGIMDHPLQMREKIFRDLTRGTERG